MLEIRCKTMVCSLFDDFDTYAKKGSQGYSQPPGSCNLHQIYRNLRKKLKRKDMVHLATVN